MPKGLAQLEQEIIQCEHCPRLREYCQEVARVKRRAYLDWDYWGRPVPGFGDPRAQVFILGLAPAAHGANRTGRVFTGDRSGYWLYRALHQTGFANQPSSDHRGDGLQLTNAWVSASVRCAPPDNKPTPQEIVACRVYLDQELVLIKQVKVVVALGRLAFDNYLGKRRSKFEFKHDGEFHLGAGEPILISSYHPSQQNTSTGKLTEPMLRAVFERAQRLVA
ncbi:uracil-DNA glycosylase [Paludibaculum fermentans]|uniref:Type-5 uracil-DNA glycosylase n=2 Tax=Paludibaculum fermentans TaxID=1473598 RepID=A0A7S7NZH0_PALFE|nr:uracil-DNA glycosylase [Paludibaculum fermentans]